MSGLFAASTTLLALAIRILSLMRCKWGIRPDLIAAVIVCASIRLGDPSFADDSSSKSLQRSDARALSHLVGESVLAENAGQVSLNARGLSAADRYERLIDWVLPPDQDVVRVTGEFRRPTTNAGQVEIASDDLRVLVNAPESGWLCWPAKELVMVADELGRLDELQTRIIASGGPDEQARDSTDALLTLVELARGEVAAVRRRLETRFAWQRTPDSLQSRPQQRWTDLLVLWGASESESATALVTEEIFGAYDQLANHDSDAEANLLDDYLSLLLGRTRDRSTPSFSLQSDESRAEMPFEWFSRMDAATHGLALPLTRFRVTENGASKMSGHEQDYLVFRWPVVGNFEASALVATHPGSFSELSVHGLAAQPVEAGNAIRIGGYAKASRQITVVPPLEEMESESHLRVDVRDGEVGHFFNGRPIYDDTVADSSAPWVALRSGRGVRAEVRNFQVSGSARIPGSIQLLDEGLRGWASYFDSGLNEGLGTWGTSLSDSGLVLKNKPLQSEVTVQEDLLRYIRPVTWDAVLEYEFLHDNANMASVHPSFGRRVFLLSRDGVLLHRLTDGRHERSGLRPDNREPLDPVLSDSSPHGDVPNVDVQLIEGWNRVRLEIQGRNLSLLLNGERIAQILLGENDSRCFGLFRYRDGMQASVRDVTLKGAWPKAIPNTHLLADVLVQELDDSAAELDVQFVHDFREGAPPELFDFDGDETSVTVMPDGLRVGRASGEGVRAMRVCAIIDGDFDIIASYRDLDIAEGQATWHCGVGLSFNLDNSTRDICAIHRRRDRMHGRHYVGFGQKETNAGGKTTWVGGANVVDESTMGRLRLARRGSTVYALHAVEDSSVFRLVKSTEVPDGRIEIHGLRFIADVGKDLPTSVTWTEMQIRAEEVDFLTAPDEVATLAKLGQSRNDLESKILDLGELSLTQAGIFSRTMDSAEVTSDGQGATATVVSGASTTRFTMSKGVTLGPEFDVEVDLDVLRFERGLKEKGSSEIVLQVALQDASGLPLDEQRTMIREATLILRHKWNGSLDLRPRVVGRGRGGKTIYLPIRTVPVKMVDQLRIAQQDQVLYFMYSDQTSDDMKVVAAYKLERKLNAVGVNFWMIAGPEERVVQTRWKKLKIYGSSPRPNVLQLEPF